MRSSRALVVLAFVGMLACSEPTVTIREQAVIEQTLTDQLRTWVRAWNNGDRDSLSAMYVQGPELTVVWVDGSVRQGWEEEELAQTSLFNSTERVNFVMQNPVQHVIDMEVALSTFSHSIDVVRLGGRRDLVRSGAGTVLWVRDHEENVWRIRMAHLSVVPTSAS